jgi:protein MAK16
LTAARLEHTIEKELLERLKMGVYGDGILNESQQAFSNALDQLEEEKEVELDMDQVKLIFFDCFFRMRYHDIV